MNENEKLIEALNQFLDLAKLQKGWRDGEGEIIDRWAIGYGIHAVMLCLDQPQTPYIYPRENGGVMVEWALSGSVATDVYLSLDPGHHGILVSTDMGSTEVDGQGRMNSFAHEVRYALARINEDRSEG